MPPASVPADQYLLSRRKSRVQSRAHRRISLPAGGSLAEEDAKHGAFGGLIACRPNELDENRVAPGRRLALIASRSSFASMTWSDARPTAGADTALAGRRSD